MSTVHRIILNTLKTRCCHFNSLNGLTFITTRPFKTSQHVVSEKKFNLDPSKIVKKDGTVIRKKTEEVKLITLIHDSSEKVLTMSEALKLAAHKRLYLVKIKKPNSKSMDFYQLSKAPELGSDQLEKKKDDMKRYIFKINIGEHDMLIKARGLIKSLIKYNISCYTIENSRKEPEKTNLLKIYSMVMVNEYEVGIK